MADDSNPAINRRTARRRQILAASMHLVRERGTGITTADIAARAHCSKETLYNWFDDRDGIFHALIEEQGAAVAEVLDAMQRNLSAHDGRSPAEKLALFGTGLLDVMTGDAAIVVNRIAMSQSCAGDNRSGTAVLAVWQRSVVDRFTQLAASFDQTGEEAQEAYHAYIGLLVGDRQRQLLLGVGERPSSARMRTMAERATRQWISLYGD